MGKAQGDRPERLTSAALVAFSMPMLPVMAVELSWRIYLPMHFSATIGVPLAVVGALLMAARMFDAALDPGIAWASDRFGTRWGHRRPWMVASLLPLMLGAALTFFAWPGMSLAALIGACLLLHLGFMMLVTPHGGWALELGRSSAQRLRIMTARTWFPMAGAVLLLLLPAFLEREWGVDRRGQVAVLGWLLLLLAPLAVLLAVRFVPEPELANTPAHEAATPWKMLRDLFQTPALRPILLLYLITGFGDAACATVFLSFVEHGLGLSGWGSTLLLVQSAVSLVALPLWARAGMRIGPGRLLAVAYGWLFCLAPLTLLLPHEQTGMAALFLAARGVVGGVEYMVLRAMVAEVSVAAADAGRRQGASSYAVSSITLKLAMGGGAWIALASLGLIDVDAASATWVPDLEQATAVRACYALPMLLSAGLGLAILAANRRTERPSRPTQALPRHAGLSAYETDALR